MSTILDYAKVDNIFISHKAGSPVAGFGNIILFDEVKIQFTIWKSKSNAASLYVGWPVREGTDKNGQKQYYPLASITNIESEKLLNKFILDEFNKKANVKTVVEDINNEIPEIPNKPAPKTSKFPPLRPRN